MIQGSWGVFLLTETRWGQFTHLTHTHDPIFIFLIFQVIPKAFHKRKYTREKAENCHEEKVEIDTSLRPCTHLDWSLNSFFCCGSISAGENFSFYLFWPSPVSSPSAPTRVSSPMSSWAEAEVNDSHSSFLARIHSMMLIYSQSSLKCQRGSVEVVTRHQRQTQGERKLEGTTDWENNHGYLVEMDLLIAPVVAFHHMQHVVLSTGQF